MNHLCEMNFLVVVSVPFTTKSWLLLKGELLQDADACIKCLTLPEVWGNLGLHVSLPPPERDFRAHFRGRACRAGKALLASQNREPRSAPRQGLWPSALIVGGSAPGPLRAVLLSRFPPPGAHEVP